jgi:hypothetical protein
VYCCSHSNRALRGKRITVTVMLRQSLCYQAELLLQQASGEQGEQVLQQRPAVALLGVVQLAVAVAAVLAQVLTWAVTSAVETLVL